LPDALRRCIKEPIQEIYAAWRTLNDAVDAHIAGRHDQADALFRLADDKKVWGWLNPAWGRPDLNVVIPKPDGDTAILSKALRDPLRDPPKSVMQAALARDGYRCRYCGIPVVDASVRRLANAIYPEAVPWGRLPEDQHAAFQCLWLQYDHVIPHSHGGRSDLENIVIACALCQFGKDRYTLAQLALFDPRSFPPVTCEWDGLSRFLDGTADCQSITKSVRVLPPMMRIATETSPSLRPNAADLRSSTVGAVPARTERPIVRKFTRARAAPNVQKGRTDKEEIDIFIPGAWISKGYIYTPPIGGKPRWFAVDHLVFAEQIDADGVKGCRVRCKLADLIRRGITPEMVAELNAS
jgi:5-methylcytosine-specific restriction endonuclease McrA